jgi:CMD domain protein
MSSVAEDVIDRLAGIGRGSHLDDIRARRLQARENAQKSYRALFEPDDCGNVTATERFAVAIFVAGLHQAAEVSEFYREKFANVESRASVVQAIRAESLRGRTHGPYGSYPPGPLSKENSSGLLYGVTQDHRSVLGPRVTAALEHAHLLVFHPRDASARALESLLAAGWSTTDIVTLSQLVAFLSFQIRSVAGLRVLRASQAVAVSKSADIV